LQPPSGAKVICACRESLLGGIVDRVCASPRTVSKCRAKLSVFPPMHAVASVMELAAGANSRSSCEVSSASEYSVTLHGDTGHKPSSAGGRGGKAGPASGGRT
jgi:hypothetical protein